MNYFKIYSTLLLLLLSSNTANSYPALEPHWTEVCGTDKCIEYDIANNNIRNGSLYYNIKYYNEHAKDDVVATIQSKGDIAGIVSTKSYKLFKGNNEYFFELNPLEAGNAKNFQTIKPFSALYMANMLAMEDTAYEYKGEYHYNSADFPEFPLYMNKLEREIKKYWKQPIDYPNASATVHFIIDKKGEVWFNTISKSSGVEEFDKKALKTIRNLSPFDPLPDTYKGKSIIVKYTFNDNKNQKAKKYIDTVLHVLNNGI